MRSQSSERGSPNRRRHRGQVRKPLPEKEPGTALERGKAMRKESRADNQQGKRLCRDLEADIKSLK